MSRIDPIRRAQVMRRPGKTEAEAADEASEAQVVRLPVPVEQVARITARERRDSQAAFSAQLIGQDGAKRGLRAGPEAFDRARNVYNSTEWSGARDRRAPKGGKARTEI